MKLSHISLPPYAVQHSLHGAQQFFGIFHRPQRSIKKSDIASQKSFKNVWNVMKMNNRRDTAPRKITMGRPVIEVLIMVTRIGMVKKLQDRIEDIPEMKIKGKDHGHSQKHN